MTDEEFNRYCAEVTGNEFFLEKHNYSPATNLNQMAEVFDRLWKDREDYFAPSAWFLMNVDKGIAKAMREFIESTAP